MRACVPDSRELAKLIRYTLSRWNWLALELRDGRAFLSILAMFRSRPAYSTA
jgi:hypothetical protein